MLARDIMTEKVVRARPTDSLFGAAELMLGARGSALLVMDDKHEILGIISEADLFRRAETDTAPAKSWLFRAVLSREPQCGPGADETALGRAGDGA